MIALDANTALRSFRDGAYDLVEIATGLNALLSNVPAIHQFKYADGKVQPMAPASLFHDLVTSFPYLTIGSTIGIRLGNGGVVLGCATEQYKSLQLLANVILPITAPAVVDSVKAVLKQMDEAISLQAVIDGSTAEYVGEGPLPIERCHIGKLIVNGLLTAEDAGTTFEGKSITSLSTQFASMQQGRANINAANVEGVASLAGGMNTEPADIKRLTHNSMTFPTDSMAGGISVDTAGSINELPAFPGGSEAYPMWFGYAGTQPKILNMVRLASGTIKIKFGAVMSYQRGQAQYYYCIPYNDGSGVRYLRVNGIAATLSDSQKLLNAPDGMTDFLIWPSWATYASGSNLSYSTFWQARVLTDAASPFPVVAVRNESDDPIKNVAIAWAFNKYISKGYERGSVNVLRRVTLPPRSSVEFLFSYNDKMNVAYMFPMRAL